MERPYNVRELYQFFVDELLKKHPEYWPQNNRNHSGIKRYYIKEYVAKPNGKGVYIREVINYKRYRAIIEEYFKLAVDRIIAGEVLALGHNLGRIAGRRCDRNFNNPKVDFKATKLLNEMQPNGRLKAVFFTDPYWVRIGWEKPEKVKNKVRSYQFDPTDGDTRTPGFRQKFSKANEADKLLQFRYKYFPLKINRVV